MKRYLLLSLALVAGCSSLVDDHCARGYLREDGTCVARQETDGGQVAVSPDAPMPYGDFDPDPLQPGPDAGPGPDASPEPDAMPEPDGGVIVDAGPDASPDAPDQGLVCAAPLEACYGACVDFQTDADHCGSCTHSCASGICTNGHCQGEPWGHIVAIGHDYVASHASQRRVLVNAVSLGSSGNVGVAWWPGETRSVAHKAPFASAMDAANRAWHEVAFPNSASFIGTGIHVVIVGPDRGDGDAAEAMGAAWATALDEFLRTGGVVIVLDGANGTNHRFAEGANLFDVGAPVTVTGQPTAVVDGTDAIVDQVLAPYLAEDSSVSWPGAPEPVITTMGGMNTIVFHIAR